MSGTSPLSGIAAATQLSIKPQEAVLGAESFMEHLNREVARQDRVTESLAASLDPARPLIAPPPFEIHPARLELRNPPK